MNNKKLLAASMAAAISGGMVAQVHAIKVQENGIGQLLLGNVYMASGGIQTNLTVVNTRTDAAVRAKVVFREGVSSQEELDFHLYLSPGDVWRGSVVEEGGKVYMMAEDDSMVIEGKVISPDNPVKQEFFNKSGNSNTVGHFEVYGEYGIAAGDYTGTAGTVTVKQGMSKLDLYDLMAAIEAAGGPNAYAGDETKVSAVNPNLVQLAGEAGLSSSDGANMVSYNMTAIGPTSYTSSSTPWMDFVSVATGEIDANCTAASTAGSCFPNTVITNVNYQTKVATVTDIGDAFGNATAPDTTDHVVAIEAALAASDVSWAYEAADGSDTFLVATFPTKYRHYGDDVCYTFNGVGSMDTTVSGSVTYYTQPFSNDSTGNINYLFTSWDNSENSYTPPSTEFSGGAPAPSAEIAIPSEVNVIGTGDAPGFGSYYASSGWAMADLIERGDACKAAYSGVPVDITVMKKTANSNFLMTGAYLRRMGM